MPIFTLVFYTYIEELGLKTVLDWVLFSLWCWIAHVNDKNRLDLDMRSGTPVWVVLKIPGLEK